MASALPVNPSNATTVLDYPNYAQQLTAVDSRLAEEIADFHGIEHVLQWMQQRQLPNNRVDIIGQDEFNYDFLIELEPQGRWLVFGVS